MSMTGYGRGTGACGKKKCARRYTSPPEGECECFYVKPAWYPVGIAERRTPFGNAVRCYNAERTLCDMLRCSKRANVEALHAALKNYAVSPQKDLHLLGQYGAMFGVEKELRMFAGLLL